MLTREASARRHLRAFLMGIAAAEGAWGEALAQFASELEDAITDARMSASRAGTEAATDQVEAAIRDGAIAYFLWPRHRAADHAASIARDAETMSRAVVLDEDVHRARAAFLSRRSAHAFERKLVVHKDLEDARRAMRSRLDTIAASETATAFNDAQHAVYRSAVAIDPVVAAQVLVREWVAQFDKRLCPTCSGLDGEQAVGMDSFPGGYEPGHVHPRCRCYFTTSYRTLH